MRKYLKRVGVASSVWVSVVLGGPSNMTFSARNWQRKKDKKCHMVPVIDYILGEDHCVTSWIHWRMMTEKAG
jgi:hypothetical protein